MNDIPKNGAGWTKNAIRILLSACVCSASPLCAGTKDDLLMGSVVKSENYKMDRTNDLEIFDGNVSFRNAVYNLKADYAIYDRKVQIWTLRGSVYCLRKFPDASNLELYCDNGTYAETFEKAELYRGKAPIRMKHVAADGKVLNGTCDRISADNAKASMDFLGNFHLRTENMETFSDNGFYSDTDRSFLIYNSPDPSLPKSAAKPAPVALGTREGRDFAMTGERMQFFKDTGDVKLYNNVAGWIKADDAPHGAR